MELLQAAVAATRSVQGANSFEIQQLPRVDQGPRRLLDFDYRRWKSDSGSNTSRAGREIRAGAERSRNQGRECWRVGILVQRDQATPARRLRPGEVLEFWRRRSAAPNNCKTTQLNQESAPLSSILDPLDMAFRLQQGRGKAWVHNSPNRPKSLRQTAFSDRFLKTSSVLF